MISICWIDSSGISSVPSQLPEVLRNATERPSIITLITLLSAPRSYWMRTGPALGSKGLGKAENESMLAVAPGTEGADGGVGSGDGLLCQLNGGCQLFLVSCNVDMRRLFQRLVDVKTIPSKFTTVGCGYSICPWCNR